MKSRPISEICEAGTSFPVKPTTKLMIFNHPLDDLQYLKERDVFPALENIMRQTAEDTRSQLETIEVFPKNK